MAQVRKILFVIDINVCAVSFCHTFDIDPKTLLTSGCRCLITVACKTCRRFGGFEGAMLRNP
jgi:hypothetical protein